METLTQAKQTEALVIHIHQLLSHWQGHRKLTRKLIEIFPEKELFDYSVGGMRPFSVLVKEMLDLAAPGLTGIKTDSWQNASEFEHFDNSKLPSTKAGLLELWDEATEQINELWLTIPLSRFQETTKAFGQWEGQVYDFILYFIDNEVHHMGQAYVYLRSLGIEPPAFWDRN